RLTRGGRDRRDLLGVVDAGDLRGDHVGALEVAAVRDDRVTRLDRTGGDLGQEWLVRHVRQRIHHRHLCLTTAKVLLELPSGVETCVASTDNQNAGCSAVLRHRGTTPRRQGVGVRLPRSDRMRRAAAVTPSAIRGPGTVSARSGRVPYRRVSAVGSRGEPGSDGGSAAGRGGTAIGVAVAFGAGSSGESARRYSRTHSFRSPI